MSIRIVRLGGPREPHEGVRLGTVRHPPRGIRKGRYAAEDWFDVWLPNLAPSRALLTSARKWDLRTDEKAWKRFATRYESEMSQSDNSRLLDALAALSHVADFSVGCYCPDEQHCHRSILRKILMKHGADVHS
jgi:uncharacterized protein YeaO (DUF488 family)